MRTLTRKAFLERTGNAGLAALILKGSSIFSLHDHDTESLRIDGIQDSEDVFGFIQRQKGQWDLTLYRQIIGSANPYKEGDATLGIAAADEDSRNKARRLLAETKLADLQEHSLYTDDLKTLIDENMDRSVFDSIKRWKMKELKSFMLASSETEIKTIIPGLPSDIIACLAKLMTNDELIQVGQKVFNPLPGSKIGSKGYLSARIQPNSPTDNIDDIVWQVFCAWSYAVGDLVLGTNPVSSEPESVAAIEAALNDILVTFGLTEVMPNCVLSHIDIQAKVEEMQPGTTGIWFQSLAGTVGANQTFDVTIEKMFRHARARQGKYGLYAETGQGADFTNGHGEGFDMVVHESRKYGFLRALKIELAKGKAPNDIPWVHVNDVAGFIGPEVFKTKEQLVRTCLEDTVMGKLHGLTIGLDICSTLHMDVTLDDLDWCIDQVMPANPAYLMALPTKNDPMLSYLTTAFNNHVKVREKFGYKVNDAMWAFFQKMQIIDASGKPTEHFGDPKWMYYQYRKAKNDPRTQAEIYKEGQQKLEEIEQRGVPIAQGYGEQIWDLPEPLEKKVKRLYEDAKVSLWSELTPAFVASLDPTIKLNSTSTDRIDYVYHPASGESLSSLSKINLQRIKAGWTKEKPDVQIVISDGLNARALMDSGHLSPFLVTLKMELEKLRFRLSENQLLIKNGRVRAGYQCGELLFGNTTQTNKVHGIIHIIGERPGSGHHNFSAYLTAANAKLWSQRGKVDHDISRVVSGISDTALKPELAAKETANIFDSLFKEQV